MIGRLLVQVDSIGLVNIVAGKKIVPEFIQFRATPSALAGEAISILRSEERLKSMRNDLRAIRQKLGSQGASKRVAKHILQMA
jgi:lipid-A-disaccharide synthase